jgi:hypothetical protein
VVFLLWHLPKRSLFDRLQFVGQIFSIDSIADHKQLHVLKQTVAPKEWFWRLIWLKASLISMRTFEFYLYQRQSIDQKRHIITVLVTSFQTDLIGDLK